MTEQPNVEAAGQRLSAAKTELDAAYANAREVGLSAIAAGGKEATVARTLGVDRMTVRKWQGKR